MHEKKINCWEFKKCKRVYGGVMDGHSGICPASTDKRFDGVHGGRNAGRACWLISGTMCNDRVQGSFGFKFKTCSLCDFYSFVKQGEGDKFTTPDAFFKRR